MDCREKKNSQMRPERRCFICDRPGHEARDCRKLRSEPSSKPEVKRAAAAVVVQADYPQTSKETMQSCISEHELLLANGMKIPLVSNAFLHVSSGMKNKMPVCKGRIGEEVVETLRYTGCSGVIVKKKFVRDDQYTGDYSYMMLIDCSVQKAPMVKIHVDTPYLTGEVEALCLPNAIQDLIIGNVPGARGPDDPDPEWKEAEVREPDYPEWKEAEARGPEDPDPQLMVAGAAIMRVQAKKTGQMISLRVFNESSPVQVTREELIKMQKEDLALQSVR